MQHRISNDEGKSLFKSYYSLSTSEKYHFLLQYTERFLTAHHKTENTPECNCSSRSVQPCNSHVTNNREEIPNVIHDKKKGIKEMLKCMPMQDRQYYSALLHI
jgi:hypothetical protein